VVTRAPRTDESPVPFVASILDPPDQGGTEAESALQALLECGEAVAQTGSWDWHLDTNQLRWSDNLYRIFGLEPGEITPTQGYVIERAHPYDRERVERQVGSKRGGRSGPLEYRIVRPDGVVRHLRASEAVVEQIGGRPRRIVGSVQDITDWHRAERAIAAHLAVAEALADWPTFEQGTTGLLRNLAVALDCVAGVLWLPEGDVLVAHVIWRSGSVDISELEGVIRQLRLPRGVGLAGQVWGNVEPRNVLSLQDDPRFPAEAVAGLRGAVALPAIHAQEVLAVLEFCCEPVSVDVTERLLRSLTGIGYELGEFLAHRRGELKPLALTPRELQVLQLAAQGCAGREIARRLVVSPATVRTHFERIYEKYGVSDRAAAVAKALRDGLID
jgi:PAS domain S-box-containing protein